MNKIKTYEILADEMKKQGRTIGGAEVGDEKLGPLKQLPGTWSNKAEAGGIDFNGFGWNLIALPSDKDQFNYRILMNQYNESLAFKTADKGVPNRGLDGSNTPTGGDQTIAAVDYEQTVEQIAVDDNPESSEEIKGKTPKGIHHEPGLFLFIADKRTSNLDIARLGTVPHGDSILAMGLSNTSEGIPAIPEFDALPIGVGPVGDISVPPADPARDYMAPYRHYADNPFKGNVEAPGFPGFEPRDVVNLLRINPVMNHVKRSTILDFDSTLATGGIVNIPFIVQQANATEMRSIFWIHELDIEENGAPVMVLQYLQIVMLEFFRRRDGVDGLIKWPHVSINTMKHVSAKAEPYQNQLTV